MSFQQRKIEFSPLNSIGSIIMMIVVMVAIYYIATGIFSFLAYIAPALLIGALIINYKVVTGYGKTLTLWKMFRISNYPQFKKNQILRNGEIMNSFLTSAKSCMELKS